MRLTPFELNGTIYYLLLNGAALFDIYDKYGSEISVLDPIKGNNRESFAAICWYLEELSTQGELYRRRQGLDPGDILDVDVLAVDLAPMDVPRARAVIQAAIAAGFFREEDGGPKEIDKGLLELEKKTGASSPGPST